MLKKIIKKYRRIIIAVVGVLLIGGIVLGIVISKNDEKASEQSGVSINAGDDNKDNQADFNGQEGQKTTKPVVEEVQTDNDFDTVIEQKGNIVGEWTTSQGDTFNCLQSDDGSLYASVSLINSDIYWNGNVDTDHSTYIKLTDDSTGSLIDIKISDMFDAAELGMNDDQVYLVLKFPDDDTDIVFRRANEDFLHEDIREVLEQEGNGISGGDTEDDQYIPEAEEIEIIEVETTEGAESDPKSDEETPIE